MKNKKLLALFLCLIMVLSISFSACGSKSQEGDNKPTGDTSNKPAEYTLPLVKDGSVKLSYSTGESWTPEYSLKDNREVQQAIEKDTGIKIDYQVIPSADYGTVIKTRIAGGDIPDIMAIDPSINPIQLYEDGLTIDHSQYINKYAPNILTKINSNPNIKAVMMGPDGKIYAAATEIREQKANVKGLYYRRDWQLALNIPDPVTIDDYYNMFLQFATKDPNKNGTNDEVALYPKATPATSGLNDLGPLATAFGLNFGPDTGNDLGFKVENGKVVYDFANPKLKDFLTYLKKYYDAGIIPKEVFGKADIEKTLLSNNRLGAYYNGVGQCDTYDKTLLKAGFITQVTKDTGYTWLNPPKDASGNRITPPRPITSGQRFVISAKCKNPELAIKWIDYVWATEKGRLYTTMGIEGKSYTMVNGKAVFTDYILKNPDGLGVHPALRTLGAFTPWIASWSDEAFQAQWSTNPKMSAIIEAAKPAYKWDTFPTMLGTAEQASKIASIQADLNTYRDESIIKFIMGQTPLSDFDKYVEQLNKLGLAELLKIKQAQYDAFSKK